MNIKKNYTGSNKGKIFFITCLLAISANVYATAFFGSADNQSYGSERKRVVIGERNILQPGEDHVLVIGNDNQIWTGASHLIVLGNGSKTNSDGSESGLNPKYSLLIGDRANQGKGGTHKIVVGIDAANNSGGNYTFAFGTGAASNLQSDYNFFFGNKAGQQWQGNPGNYNFAFGEEAGQDISPTTNITNPNNKGEYNIALGYKSGQVVKGNYNFSVGSQAGQRVVGDNNYAMSNGAGQDVSGNNNIALGLNAGQKVKGDWNVSIGTNAGQGISNDAYGKTGQNADNNTHQKGANNVAIGKAAGGQVKGNQNIAIGENAGIGVTHESNIALGYGAGQYVSHQDNIAAGVHAGSYVSGESNVTFGKEAGKRVSGNYNHINGYSAGNGVSGEGNIIMGHEAGSGKDVKVGTETTAYTNVVSGNYNTIIGKEAGKDVAGNDNIIVGTAAGGNTTASISDIIAVGTKAKAEAEKTIALGFEAKTTVEKTVAIGTKAEANIVNSVALGTNSVTNASSDKAIYTNAIGGTISDVSYTKGTDKYVSETIDGHTYNFAGGGNLTLAGKNSQDVGIVSVGSTGNERRIQHVAPGLISETSTDAINGSQLYSVIKTAVIPNITFRSGGSSNSGVYTQGTTDLGSVAASALGFDFGNGLKASSHQKDGKTIMLVELDKDRIKNDTDFKGSKGEQGIQGPKGDKGDRGLDGKDGNNGDSAYDIWVKDGNIGSKSDFLTSLKGDKGLDGTTSGDSAVVYIDKDGNKVYRIEDNFYKELNQNGTGKGSFVPSNEVRVSLNDPRNINNQVNNSTILGNVAPGEKDTDAVNVAQLKKVEDKVDNINTSFDHINEGIRDVRNEGYRIGALSAALAALNPIQFDKNKPNQIMAGIGTYHDKNAIAVGLAHYFTENLMMTTGVSMSGEKKTRAMANVGLTWKFGKTSDSNSEDRKELPQNIRKNIPNEYKTNPISSIQVMQNEIMILKSKELEKDRVIQNLNSKIESLEKKIETLLNK